MHNDVLYGDDYRWDRCGALSEKCQAHFVNEACFYECDVHAGKWRMYETCDDADGGNGWQLLGMPIKASLCDSFYEDCKDDLFCVTAESKSFFALPTCDIATQCQKFSDIYANGKEMCELLWDNSQAHVCRRDPAPLSATRPWCVGGSGAPACARFAGWARCHRPSLVSRRHGRRFAVRRRGQPAAPPTASAL